MIKISNAIGSTLNESTISSYGFILATNQWLELIRYLGQFNGDIEPRRPGQIAGLHKLDAAANVVFHAAKLLEDWPVNFHWMLKRIQQPAPLSPSIRRTFGRLYRVLYFDLKDHVFQLLRDEFESYLHQNWWGTICKRNRSFDRLIIKNHPRITVEGAAKLSGVSKSVVKHLAQRELISFDKVALPSGRMITTVDGHLSLHVLKKAKNGITLSLAAHALSLPKNRVRELIAEGVISPLVFRPSSRSSSWLISSEQIRLLLIHPHSEMSGGELIGFQSILKYWRLRKGEFASLVRAVVNKSLRALGDTGLLVPIGKLRFDRTDVRQWLDNYRATENCDMSVDQAAKFLGLKQQVAYDLVRLGLLGCVESDGIGRRISAANLKEFRTQYVALSEIGRCLNRSPRALINEICVKPVCGPTINGSRQYFYLRSEIAKNVPTFLA